MSIELPRDAEGREIPLDTEVLYDLCETKVSVKEFLFVRWRRPEPCEGDGCGLLEREGKR